jgi:hypothetical protein
MKHIYEVKHAGYQLEGLASSPQNACRKAFRTLIRMGKIKQQPKTDNDTPSSFANTKVRLIK